MSIWRNIRMGSMHTDKQWNMLWNHWGVIYRNHWIGWSVLRINMMSQKEGGRCWGRSRLIMRDSILRNLVQGSRQCHWHLSHNILNHSGHPKVNLFLMHMPKELGSSGTNPKRPGTHMRSASYNANSSTNPRATSHNRYPSTQGFQIQLKYPRTNPYQYSPPRERVINRIHLQVWQRSSP